MASLLLRLERSAAAGRVGYSLIGRICTGFLRSPNSFCGILCARALQTSAPPRLMLPPVFEGPRKIKYEMYNLAEKKVESLQQQVEEEVKEFKFVGSSHGWLALFTSLNNSIVLSNPLTRQQIKLPPLSNTIMDREVEEGSTVWKLILSHSPEEEDCRAMMSFGARRGNNLAFCTTSSTHWTRIGRLDEEPSRMVLPEDIVYYDTLEDDMPWFAWYHDFVYSPTRRLFFSITDLCRLAAWDLHYPRSPAILLSDYTSKLTPGHHKITDTLRIHDDNGEEKVTPEYWPRRHLVIDHQSGQLFAVTRYMMARVGNNGGYVRPIYYGSGRGWDDSYPYKTIGFDVIKIDQDKRTRQLKEAYLEDSLDGLAMFVGLNHSFVVSAAEFPELKPNAIYFTDVFTQFTPAKRTNSIDDGELPYSPRWVPGSTYGGHDIGIFDYEKKTFSPCYYPCDPQSMERITPPPIWWFTSH